MAINDPTATRFVNETIRPLAERLRAIAAEIDSMRVTYDAQLGAFFSGHGNEAIEDGRTDGAPALVGNDVLAFVAAVPYDLKALLDANGGSARAAIAKLCVRPLQAN